MAAFTTLATIGSAVLGAGAGIKQAKDARSTSRRQRREMERQETAAREAAALDETRDDTGADIRLGRDETVTATTSTTTKTGTRRKGAVKSRVGGLSKRPSAGVGL